MSQIAKDSREELYQEAFSVLARQVSRRWGIQVFLRPVADPFTGDLDGAEIDIDPANSSEEALFLLIHLFGHTVQWNLDPEAHRLGRPFDRRPTEAELVEIRRYEEEACRYGLSLLHGVGIDTLDGWLADYARCDFAYLRHLYLTGEKLPFRTFWRSGTKPLEPLPVPEFTPRRQVSRGSGVVL